MDTNAQSQDLNYLLYRQQVERLRAEDAQSEKARDAHLELARQYERAIERATAGDFSISRSGTES
jgi:hypothetical protein